MIARARWRSRSALWGASGGEGEHGPTLWAPSSSPHFPTNTRRENSPPPKWGPGPADGKSAAGFASSRLVRVLLDPNRENDQILLFPPPRNIPERES